MTTWRGTHALLAAAAFALTLVIPYTLTGALHTGDLRDITLPAEDFFRRELSAGRLPLWDDRAALGYPVLASAQIGFWYPPLFVLRILPPEPALALALAVHLVLLAVGMARYAQSLRQSPAASVLTAAAFTGSGFVLAHLTHANIVFPLAWLPWALLLADRLAQTLRPRTGLLLALLLATATLAGHFQIATVIAALVLARFLVILRTAQRGTPWGHTAWTALLVAGPLLVGVVLLVAAQLFPTLELLRVSTRGGEGGFPLERANQHSFPPWQLASFVLPAFFGFPDLSEYWGTRPLVEMGAWVGTIPLLLALVGAAGAGWVSKRRSETRDSTELVLPSESASRIEAWRARPQLFWILLAAVGFFLALGRWSPFRLIGLEPTLGIFSGPARYLVLTHLGLAILAGTGLDAFARRTHRTACRAIGAIGLGIAAATVVGSLLVQTQRPLLHQAALTLADRWIVGQPGHMLPQATYDAKISFLLDRLGTWGVNLANPSVALSFSLLALGGIVLWTRGSAIIHESTSKNSDRILPPLLIAAVMLELIVMAWQVHPRVPWSEVFRASPVIARLKDEEPRGRLYVIHPQGDTGLLFANPTTADRDEHERLLRDLAVANIHTRWGFSGIEWPAALDLAVASRVLDALRDAEGRPVRPDLLDRLSVRYVAGSSLTPGLDLPSPARVLARHPSGEGATITTWERPFADPAKPWRSGAARPRVELLTERPVDIHQPLPPVAGRAEITAETPQRITITAENTTRTDAALVLRDTFYPGWHATLDENAVPIERADTLFRGVRVPPGRHTVQFTYAPQSARLGILLSALGWAAACGLLLRRHPVGQV